MKYANHTRSRVRSELPAARLFVIVAVAATMAGTAPRRADAQQQSHTAAGMASMTQGPLGIPESRDGSGTSWMPDATPMYAIPRMWGAWSVMLHGAAFGQFDVQGATRGSSQFGVVNWGMLMARRPLGSGTLDLAGMASLEPATIGSRGYPLLLQTGESYKGQPLHDRQHPHDAFVEVAATYRQPIARNLAFELYAAPVGEPALGPVTFMHRPSAENDPLAPIGHHWQDATHISFGVATVGLYSRVWKLEGSWFNGVEPDENRWNFDFGRFDSYSGRLTVNPNARVTLAAWYGFLPHPERLNPAESVHRYGASAMYVARGIGSGAWASTLLWSANRLNGVPENSVLAESNLEIGDKNALFGRLEYVRKSAQDLVLGNPFPPDRAFGVNAIVAGYVHEIAAIRGGSIGLGGRVSVNVVPSTLQSFYGTRTPAGIDVYIRIRPSRMTSSPAPTKMKGMPGMPGMEMSDEDAGR